MATTNHNYQRQTKTYNRKQLMERGWTQKLINMLLPPPAQKRNYKYRGRSPILLWGVETVVKAEESSAFQKHIASTYEKRDKAYSEFVKTHKLKLETALTQPRVLEVIARIDYDIREMQQEIVKAMRASGKRSISIAKLREHRDSIISLQNEVRNAYLERFNSTYDFNIQKAEIEQVNTHNTPIQDLVFRAIVNEEIPKHPKNEYAFTRLIKRHFIIHEGVTNTGKTYQALQALKKAETGVYLAPLRLLALQVYQQLNEEGSPCNLLTGEEEIIVPGARYVSSTVEKMSLEHEYDVAVIDEAQMIADAQRGSAWTRAVLGVMAKEVHICCSQNAVNILTELIGECGDTYEIIVHERDTPLVIDERQFHFPKSVESGDALIAFSKRMVISIASYLADNNIKASVIYGNLPPETRRKQVELFLSKETKVVVATDAIGMGLNLPIKRIVFMETSKYDGTEDRTLNAAEVKQIAGRAGRRSMYDEGLVNTFSDKAKVRRLLNSQLADIDGAYYLPLDKYVLSLPLGTLKERLVETVLKGSKVSPFKGADIEQPLKLLEYIKEDQKLSMGEMYNLIFIPFDINDSTLLEQWKRYHEAYSAKKDISFPMSFDWDDIDSLETYYKQLDLYYSFCKSMDIPFEADAVAQTKQETADRINTLLLTRLKNMGKKCRICNKKLEWNYPYGICQNCFEKQNATYTRQREPLYRR